MHTDTLVGKWSQFRNDSKREWSKLTDEDLDQIKGNAERLVGMVQEKYGFTRDQAKQEVTRSMDSHDSRAYRVARRIPGDMDHHVRQHPWTAIATAIGLGIALGFLAKSA